MTKLLFLFLTSITVAQASDCMLTIDSENLLGLSAGTACVNVSSAAQDEKGIYRRMTIEERRSDGDLVQHKPLLMRPGSQLSMKSVAVPGMGTMNVIVLKVSDANTAVLSFLNGNSLKVTIDKNNSMDPDHICVQQTAGVNQVRGLRGHCP